MICGAPRLSSREDSLAPNIEATHQEKQKECLRENWFEWGEWALREQGERFRLKTAGSNSLLSAPSCHVVSA